MSTMKLVRWSGMSLILAGILFALATIIHPSSETVNNILAQEGRLITGHWLLAFFCVFLLLGLTGFYAIYAARIGRVGLAGFLLAFIGTLFFGISSDYGFNAPVLARLAPNTLNAINAYPPVMIMDVLMVVCMLSGFIMLGIAILRLKAFPTWVGIVITIGWPMYLLAGAISLEIFQPLWYLAILSAFLTGAGLSWIGYTLWSETRQVVAASEGC